MYPRGLYDPVAFRILPSGRTYIDEAGYFYSSIESELVGDDHRFTFLTNLSHLFREKRFCTETIVTKTKKETNLSPAP